MRVLHVIPTVGSAFGGPTIAVHAMTRALADRGHSVVLVTTDAADDGAGRLEVPLGEPVTKGGVVQWYFPRTMAGRWKFSWPLTGWLRATISTFDVVHVHGLFQYPTIAGCRLARHARIPYVLRPLGNLDDWSLQQAAWKKRPYMSLIEKSHIRHAAALHATSASEASALQRFSPRRVAVIPLGVDPPSAPHPDSRPPDGAPLRVLYLSRLHPKKEIPVLLEAIRLTRSKGVRVELTVGGSGAPEYETELRALSTQLGVNDIVRWTGHVQGTEKVRLFEESDVFVLPSRQENFGIAVAEALSAGMPVIISKEVAISDDVERAGAGIVLPIDAARFAEALELYATEPLRRRAAGVAAAGLARSAYSWPACAERLESLYSELIAPRVKAAHP